VGLRELNAVVLLDKPAGCTSNAILQQVRRIYRAKKAGHTGSLDPAATGMLPICFGEGTKLCGYLLDAEKTYETEGVLGATTDTDDAEGQIMTESEVPPITDDEMNRVVRSFLGESMQRPPVYSAIKRNGVRAHKLARSGQTPELDPRPVTVHDIELTHFDGRRFGIRMHVSKGTYVRAIVRDIGEKLGCGAHVTTLRRLSVSPFGDHPMHSVEEIEQHTDKLLLNVDAVISDWPSKTVDEESALKFRHGSKPVIEAQDSDDLLRVYGPDDRFLGLGKVSDGRLQTVRIIGAQLQ
jgi:tRNA pseudouridine55 synthase